ncbi:MAG TPA: ADP-dependent glucokinase/phosphofructokinase [Propionibacteriaceae bacterium]
MGDRLVLGLGGTVDIEIVWDSATLEGLVQAYGVRAAEIDTAVSIETERDLLCSLLGFVRDGSGGERFVVSSEIVTAFASRFGGAVTLGGTPVRAALAMDKLGVATTVHLVSIDDHVRRLLPPSCDYVCSASEDTTDPHLIVQFGAGDRVRSGDVDVTAPFPNRVIFTNDPPNRELVLSSELGSVLADARVFMVSGFNVIQTEALVRRRVVELREHMTRLPPDALVIYEDAGFHFPALSRVVWEMLRGQIDVGSMNEDEMQAYLGRPLDLLDPVAMSSALLELFRYVGVPTLVVHTKYWALALGRDAATFAPALDGGITMASARYCHGDHFTRADYEVLAAMPRTPAGAAFAAALEARMGAAVRCVPANTLTVDNATTIGLGDTFVGGFIAALPDRIKTEPHLLTYDTGALP